MYPTVPQNQSINYTMIISADDKTAVIKGMTVVQ